MNTNHVCTITSGTLVMITMMMVLPAQGVISNDLEFGGYLTLAKFDENGNNVFVQTVHNRLVDTGETFLLQQVFQEGTTVGADAVQIGAICVTDEVITISEALTAATFDTGNGITETNCKEDTTVTLASQTAQIGAITFSAGGANVADGDTITAIGICQNDATDDGDFANCATEGILFAAVDTADVTLNAGETVQITYTFDISSAST